MIRVDPKLFAAAREGSRPALSALVRSLQGPVFNLAVRMLGHVPDADDATQEILIKIVTHLGDVRDPAAAGGWAFRIACRHLVRERRRGTLESRRLTFTTFAEDLEDGLADMPDELAADPESRLLVEEVKIGCTLALLTCLSRALRSAYILGEIYELSDTEAAAALEIDAAAFRQRLRRARAMVTRFTQARCGIVSSPAKCRCERRVGRAVELGRIEKGRRTMPPADQPGTSIESVRSEIARLEQGRAAAALMRSNPQFASEAGDVVMRSLAMP